MSTTAQKILANGPIQIFAVENLILKMDVSHCTDSVQTFSPE